LSHRISPTQPYLRRVNHEAGRPQA
jgi:hypothetical protein